jgi:hypothetical protein
MVTEVAKCGKRLNKSIRSVADLVRPAHRAIPSRLDPARQAHEGLGFALIDLFIAIFILQFPTQEMST